MEEEEDSRFQKKKISRLAAIIMWMGKLRAGSLSKLLTQEYGINPKSLCFWEKGVATEFSLIRIFILLKKPTSFTPVFIQKKISTTEKSIKPI